MRVYKGWGARDIRESRPHCHHLAFCLCGPLNPLLILLYTIYIYIIIREKLHARMHRASARATRATVYKSPGLQSTQCHRSPKAARESILRIDDFYPLSCSQAPPPPPCALWLCALEYHFIEKLYNMHTQTLFWMNKNK